MFKKVPSVATIMDDGKKQPVIIFKHSTACSVSARAKGEVEAFMKETGKDVCLVVVQDEKMVSNELADKLKIQHESPQLLVVDKKNVTVLNHFSITKDKICGCLSAHQKA
jgi:bacillithiol system protein YtxJ